MGLFGVVGTYQLRVKVEDTVSGDSALSAPQTFEVTYADPCMRATVRQKTSPPTSNDELMGNYSMIDDLPRLKLEAANATVDLSTRFETLDPNHPVELFKISHVLNKDGENTTSYVFNL